MRPRRTAHPAVGQAQADSRAGDTWGVDMDRERVWARGTHEGLLSRVRRRVQDRRVLTLSHWFLKAGGLTLEGSGEPTAEGTLPGGPRSPRLANRLLDELDPELEQRGHRGARDADAATISGRRRQAGARGRASGTRVLERTLRRTGNAAKSAGDRPWHRACLGCTCTRRQPNRRQGSEKALQACNAQGRERTGRPRGRAMRQIVTARRQRRLGWRACFGFAAVRSPRRDRAKGIRRRRSSHGQPGGRKR